MPETPESSYQHIRIRRTNIEQPRYKPSRSISPPKKDNTEFGLQLDEKAGVLQRTFAETIALEPPDFDPAFIFRLKLDAYVSPDDWRRSRLTLLSEEPDGVVVLFSEDQLVSFRERIGEYAKEIEPDRKLPSYAWIAALTTDMELWNREDRIGQKLRDVEISATELYRVDVELWHHGAAEDCTGRMKHLRQYVIEAGGDFLDSYLHSSLSIARIKISGEALNRLLDVGDVQTIDLPPSPQLNVGAWLNTQIDDFPNPVPNPPENAPGICIVDSGIHRGHPMLGPAIGDTVAVPSSLGDGLDRCGHGTMVAGIALYGDVQRCIDNLDFRPPFYLFGARVTNADNRFDDDRLIIRQMRDAIQYFHDAYGCRVFNISLGDPRLVYQGGKPSAWAQVLDELARELDIVIVISAGNLPMLGISGPDADCYQAEYPSYLLEPQARIIEPATAANALTVGALAHCADSFHAARHPNDPAIQCIADVDQPSPFTRSGFGVNNAIKPDVCEYGGNAVWDGHGASGGRILNKDPGVGIVSMNMRHTERLFTADVGTSFAAPRVAHLAGLVLAQYPDISGNLVRALIASSACIPEPAMVLFPDDTARLRVCGYGQPDMMAALFSKENRVTLVAEDVLPLGSFHLYEVPIPDEFKQVGGERRITVTLAFDPPVRHTRKDYLGTKMNFRLFRGLTAAAITAWYGERGADADPERIPNRYQCDMTPSVNVRERGTLQKATFLARHNRSLVDYEGNTFHLMIHCQAGWAAPDVESQRYAVVVTLECPQGLISLYNVIKQQVRLPQRVQIRESY